MILQELFPFTTGNYLIDAVYCKQSCMISTDITIINVLVFMLFNPNYFLEFLCMISYFKRLKKVIHVLYNSRIFRILELEHSLYKVGLIYNANKILSFFS